MIGLCMCEIDAHQLDLSHIIVIAQFGLERQLYSTAEGDEDLEVCVELLQGNITQRTFIGIGTQSGQCNITSTKSSYLLSHKDTHSYSFVCFVCSSHRCLAFKHIFLDI